MTIAFPLIGSGIAPSSAWTQDQGVDIAAPAHTKLAAIADGTIIGHGLSGFGADTPILRIDSGPLAGKYVYYGHAGPAGELPIGTKVKAGQVIGEVGAGIVGISTGPHLEIGINTSPFPAAMHATSAEMLALLRGATGTGGVLDTVGNAAGDVAGAVGDAAGAVVGVPANLAGDVAKDVVGGVWGAVSGTAMRMLLYVLLVGGGLALALGGAKHLGLKLPQPPNVGIPEGAGGKSAALPEPAAL